MNVRCKQKSEGLCLCVCVCISEQENVRYSKIPFIPCRWFHSFPPGTQFNCSNSNKRTTLICDCDNRAKWLWLTWPQYLTLRPIKRVLVCNSAVGWWSVIRHEGDEGFAQGKLLARTTQQKGWEGAFCVIRKNNDNHRTEIYGNALLPP